MYDVYVLCGYYVATTITTTLYTTALLRGTGALLPMVYFFLTLACISISISIMVYSSYSVQELHA